MYNPDGHMCAQIMDSDRPAWKDPDNPTNAEKIAYYDSFIAYCGTYQLSADGSFVTHYPTVAWSQAYIGSAQVRHFKLEGNRLIIAVVNPDRGAAKRVLVWERGQP